MFSTKNTIDRRHFISSTLVGSAALATAPLWVSMISGQEATASSTNVVLPPLPFDRKALEPYISANTIEYHYGKHHAGYVKKTINFIKNTPYATLPLEEIIKKTQGNGAESAIFNNAAQVWNHTFYWNSMKPGGGGKPNNDLLNAINDSFGSFTEFKNKFLSVALSRFGSGWAWLVSKDGKLDVMNTANAETPLAIEINPLLTIDVWEHAYYLDYQNGRSKYVENCIEHLLNWDFAAKNFAAIT